MLAACNELYTDPLIVLACALPDHVIHFEKQSVAIYMHACQPKVYHAEAVVTTSYSLHRNGDYCPRVATTKFDRGNMVDDYSTLRKYHGLCL